MLGFGRSHGSGKMNNKKNQSKESINSQSNDHTGVMEEIEKDIGEIEKEIQEIQDIQGVEQPKENAVAQENHEEKSEKPLLWPDEIKRKQEERIKDNEEQDEQIKDTEEPTQEVNEQVGDSEEPTVNKELNEKQEDVKELNEKQEDIKELSEEKEDNKELKKESSAIEAATSSNDDNITNNDIVIVNMDHKEDKNKLVSAEKSYPVVTASLFNFYDLHKIETQEEEERKKPYIIYLNPERVEMAVSQRRMKKLRKIGVIIGTVLII
ncbi:hypothetical protein ENBRE01_2464, partial [Enteropsectra breve]